MAPKRLRRASSSVVVDDPIDDVPAAGLIDVDSLARAAPRECSTVQQNRQRPRTFASQTVIGNNLCDDKGVQKESLYGNVLITSAVAQKTDYKRYSNVLKYGMEDPPAEEEQPLAGLLKTHDILLEGKPFKEFVFTKDKKYLGGLTLPGAAGAYNCMTISPEHSAMVANVAVRALRNAGECTPCMRT